MTDKDRELMRRLKLGGATESELDRLASALDRARVVGVLDAWADAHPTSAPFATSHKPGERWCSASRSHGLRKYWGDNPDAARAAAAKAIDAGEV